MPALWRLAFTAFQAETPSWDPTSRFVGVTFGTWRRVVDDFHYPDIAQDVGILSADSIEAARPLRAIATSVSEDQALCWSPNGKWIAFHSHKDQSDDLWLLPAGGGAPARQITHFGRGFETGWPRWSPDGTRIVFGADSRSTPRRNVIYVIGVDQTTGQVTFPEREIAMNGLAGDAPRIFHQFTSDHRFSGIAVSPDGRWTSFPAPAGNGYFQLYRVPTGGGTAEQLTFDPSNKTQPAVAPDGRRIAFTVWQYDVQFWLLEGPPGAK
jgi:Tol biopolymer transport system component